jgi:site-specific recombinase XerD
MASITTADARNYVARRQAAGAANATINRELAALKRMFTLAALMKLLMGRPLRWNTHGQRRLWRFGGRA